jgi:hypothetical protein
MSADDRLKVIARHIGAARNNVYPSVVRHLCSSESQSSELVHGGVTVPPIGPSSDARKPRKSKQVHSVIPKNRYEYLVCICFELNRISLYFLIGLNDRETVIQFLSRARVCSLVQSIQNGCGVHPASCVVGTEDCSYSLKRPGSLIPTAEVKNALSYISTSPHAFIVWAVTIVFLYRCS